MVRFAADGDVAVFGGSFNPPHSGHIKLVEYCLEKLTLAGIILLPAYDAPHKEEKAAAFRHRIHMLRLAFAHLAGRVNISIIEKYLERPSYTYKTMRELKKHCSRQQLCFIMGEDMFNYLPKWKNTAEIVSSYPLIVFNRGGADVEMLPLDFIRKPVVVTDFDYPISSTEFRQSLQQYYITNDTEILDKLALQLPPHVIDYMVEQRLYNND